MQKKFQIFVSSTYQDLIEERRAVIEAILDLGHIPIGMEAFQASNEEQWSYIRKRIDEADYYVVIVAERYGSTNDQGVSFTEMEYDYAREKGVPVAAFLLHEDARSEWRSRKADALDNRERVEAFRRKCHGFMVKYWNDKADLAASCVTSLTRMFSDEPRDGWIPAREAVRPEIANQLARLSEENETLRKAISDLNDKYGEADPHNLMGKMVGKFLHSDKATAVVVDANTTYLPIRSVIHLNANVKISYLELFLSMSRTFLPGATMNDITRAFDKIIKDNTPIVSQISSNSDKVIKMMQIIPENPQEFFEFLEVNDVIQRTQFAEGGDFVWTFSSNGKKFAKDLF